ncbi:uncharacterized protein LOC111069555 [Drosophila obscura]|uniref:uncharacterized protein LOC111069555 n=1 Tax=Drosophila obscura TaxID=7282 RepID=UPI001BB17908|nr:uncharacterized protein LOC111069555 [Drosophila obscura]
MPGNKKKKKNVEKYSLADFHHIVDTNDEVNAKSQRKSSIIECQPSKMASSTRGRDATGSNQKLSNEHADQEYPNVPNGRDNSDMSRKKFQAPAKPKRGDATTCDQQPIYSSACHVIPEPSLQRAPWAPKGSGNKKNYNKVFQVPAQPSRLIDDDHIVYSEISELFPPPSYQSAPFEPQGRGGLSTTDCNQKVNSNKGRGNQYKYNGVPQVPANIWGQAAARGMYEHELAYNRCHNRGGGNQNIYNGVSQRPPNTWRHRDPYALQGPQIDSTVSHLNDYSEISQLLPGPPQPPCAALDNINHQKICNKKESKQGQGKGASTDADPSQNICNKTFDVLPKATEPRRKIVAQAAASNCKQISRVKSPEVLIPWAQRVQAARMGQKIKILKRPEPTEVTYTITDEPLRGLPGGEVRVRSCPPIPTPARCVPKELEQVDRMTSADFRHDYNAHVQNMRTRLKNQEHMHYFAQVIRENTHLFKGRVILVLSCGVGTLALMAARLGEAKRVYAVDHSMVTNYAELVVKQNHYEHTVKVMHGRMADLQLPEKVDGIVCNWMGHSLLWDSEILEVLEARDRWLKRNGFILPDMAILYLLGAAEPKLKGLCDWWRNVYGFNMSAMRRCALSEPRYAKTNGDGVLTLCHRVLYLDLKTATKKDLQIDCEIRLKVVQDGHLECFTLYFDVKFSRCHRNRTLSCNPCRPRVHNSLWLQTTLFVESSFVLRENHYYAGRFIFRPLKEYDMNQFEILLKFFVSRRPEGDLAGCFGNRLVAKRWLMMDRHQTVAEVDSCQDEDY